MGLPFISCRNATVSNGKTGNYISEYSDTVRVSGEILNNNPDLQNKILKSDTVYCRFFSDIFKTCHVIKLNNRVVENRFLSDTFSHPYIKYPILKSDSLFSFQADTIFCRISINPKYKFCDIGFDESRKKVVVSYNNDFFKVY